MQTVQLKNAIAETPASVDMPHSGMEGAVGKKSVSWKTEEQKLPSVKNKKKIYWKKIDGALQTRGMITKDLTCKSSQQQEERRKSAVPGKVLKGMMAENFPILANDRNLQIQRAEQTSNSIQPKKNPHQDTK